jgi:hypothetical protein
VAKSWAERPIVLNVVPSRQPTPSRSRSLE